MEDLKNKIAVITGGNSGIGYATAKALKVRGATVIITGRRKEAVAQAAGELGVTGIVSDQANVKQTGLLAAQVKEQFTKIDILFINAGIVGNATVEDASEELFDQVMGINFKGAYFTLNKFFLC